MTQQTINIGTVANDGTGDPARTAFDKVNDNFAELAGTYVTLDSAAAATANTAAIQAKLDEGGTVRVGGQGVVYINASLVIGDNTTLIVEPGCTLKAAAGTNDAVVVTEAYTRSDFTVSSITSSGNVCTATTSVDHGFAVGDYVAISWADPEGYSGVFQVLTAATSTTFTYDCPILPSAATATAGSGGTMKVRKATYRPTIISNGTIDYNDAESTGTDGVGLMCVALLYAFRPVVSGRFVNAQKYNVLVACCADVVARDLVLAGVSDGIHLTGPIFGADITNVTGDNDDNLVAVGTSDYSTYAVSEGMVLGVKIRNVRGEGTEPVRLFGSDTWSIDVEVDGVSGGLNETAPLVRCLQDTSVVPNGRGWFRRLVVRNVIGFNGNTAKIALDPWRADYLEVSGVTMGESSGTSMHGVSLGSSTDTSGTITAVDTGTNVLTDAAHGLLTNDRITIWSTSAVPTGITQGRLYFVKKIDADTFTVALTAGGTDIDITGAGSGTITWRFVGCHIDKASIIGVTNLPAFATTAAPNVYVGQSANINVLDVIDNTAAHSGTTGLMRTFGSVQVVNFRNTFYQSVSSGKLLDIGSTVPIPMKVSLNGVRVVGASWAVSCNPAINADVYSTASVYETVSQPFRHAGATGRMRLYSAANDYQALTNAMVKTSSATLEAYGWDIPMDVDNLTTTAEQFCRNTDATSTAGIAAGICRYRGGWALV